MARRLNEDETQEFSDAAAAVGHLPAANDELTVRDLNERCNEAMKLSPDSGVWFGDIFPGAFGFDR